MAQQTFQVASGYSRDNSVGTYRNPANVAEMHNWCSSHAHITILSTKGKAITVKVNGAVKTWKRDPNRIEVPVKYGLYEYGTLDASDIERVLIPV